MRTRWPPPEAFPGRAQQLQIQVQLQLQFHLRVQVQVEFVCPKLFLSLGHDVRCACLPVLNQGKRFEIVLPFGRVERERDRDTVTPRGTQYQSQANTATPTPVASFPFLRKQL